MIGTYLILGGLWLALTAALAATLRDYREATTNDNRPVYVWPDAAGILPIWLAERL